MKLRKNYGKHRRNLVNLVKKCFESQKIKNVHNSIEAAQNLVEKRQEQFNELVNTVRKLETTEVPQYGMMFDYEKGLKQDHDEDAKQISDAYNNGKLDPNNWMSNFEKRNIIQDIKNRSLQLKFTNWVTQDLYWGDKSMDPVST